MYKNNTNKHFDSHNIKIIISMS